MLGKISQSNSTMKYSEQSIKVLRQMYMLLMFSILAASGIAAFVTQTGMAAMVSSSPGMYTIGSLVVMIGLIIMAHKNVNSSSALVWYSLFVAAMGVTSGIALTGYVQTGQMAAIANAAVGTLVIFGTLTAYSYASGRDFSQMRGFLLVGLIGLIVMLLLNVFFIQSGPLMMALSVIGVLVFSGFILYDTSNVLHGHETNYVSASISMFLNIVNLFHFLLNLMSGRE